MRLKGRKVLITGTGGGQGAAAQALFAKSVDGGVTAGFR